ncbi:STAS domain-containing protein [Frigidibacter sp. MR17.24]|uniref:STAS domain-containing protein n=1 Tax=Frigidibacter sp. MR17.24 TaxID=3127345 RepID=UPI003012F4A3
MSAVFALPARLDFNAAVPLAHALRDHAGDDLALDVTAVSHLGGLCLQVLLAAAQSWRGAGHSLSLTGCSPAVDEALTLFGIDAGRLAARNELEVAA